MRNANITRSGLQLGPPKKRLKTSLKMPECENQKI